MNTEHLSQHFHNVLLTLILATNVLLLFKEGSPSLVKPSQARAEGSGIRKLQHEQEEYEVGVDGDVAMSHRSGSRNSRNRRGGRDALFEFADLDWQTRVVSGAFDALDKNNNGRLDFCELRQMVFEERQGLLVVILNQISLYSGGPGFTQDDFDAQNPIGDRCPGTGSLVIPVDDLTLFPFGFTLNFGELSSNGWWSFMLRGIARMGEPFDPSGFLSDYSSDEWHNLFSPH